MRRCFGGMQRNSAQHVDYSFDNGMLSTAINTLMCGGLDGIGHEGRRLADQLVAMVRTAMTLDMTDDRRASFQAVLEAIGALRFHTDVQHVPVQQVTQLPEAAPEPEPRRRGRRHRRG